MNTIYSVLNWNRDCDKTILSLPKGCDVILCSNVNGGYKAGSKVAKHVNNIYILDAVQNIAKCKNMIFDKARELKFNYLFILEDDVIVNNIEVFDKYIDLMSKYDLGVTMYSFDKLNRAMNNPNPSLKIILDEDGNEIWVVRYSCSSCWGIDITRSPYIIFDESVNIIENDLYLKTAYNNKHLPFYGFYFDIPHSNIYFDRMIDVPTERIKTKEQIDLDMKYTKEKSIDMTVKQTADDVINYIRKKIGV